MNRIVREHYPVADLPDDLREGFADAATVRVVIEPDIRTVPPVTPTPLSELFARARPSFGSFEDVVDHVEGLRADWE